MIRASLAVLSLLVFASAAAAAGSIQDGHYKIDPTHTFAHFEISHMGVSTMRGRMDVTGGTIVIDRSGTASRVEVTLDPASVDTGDAARDDHLRDQKGFFEVQQYPKIRFVSKKVVFDDDDPGEATVHGKLTLHGKTRPVSLEVDDIACRVDPLDNKQYRCGFAAETTIERSDYGMDAFSSLVGDTVELNIEAEAVKPRSES